MLSNASSLRRFAAYGRFAFAFASTEKRASPAPAAAAAAAAARCSFGTNLSPVASSRSLSFSSSSSVPSPSIESVGVVGLGLMGHGICQVAASCPSHRCVVAYESQQKFLDVGRERIERSVSKMLDRGKITSDEADGTLSKIKYTTDADELGDVDLVVEAVVEDVDLKREVYGTLSSVCKPGAIFASNTSSLSIAEMAEFSDRPDRFVGVHFFNPVQIMKLVEVIRTERTSPDVFDAAYEWVERMGKVPVKCGDTPGFIVNRLLIPNLVQAMLMAERGDATVGDIDVSMKLGAGHPMGPIQLADYVGLDTSYYIIRGWAEKYPNEPAFVVPKCLERKVNEGNLGRKTGEGFYVWDGDKCGDPAE